MKKLLTYLSLVLCLIFSVYGCGSDAVLTDKDAAVVQQIEVDDTADVSEVDVEDETEAVLDESVSDVEDSEAVIEEDASADVEAEDEFAEVTQTIEEQAIDEDGSYTSPEDVALYIHTYGKLPKNFITKQDAQELGWVSNEGNLDEVAPGMSIGGNRFGNYEQSLPDGNYKECDVNYTGGYRGDERLVYSEDGSIYYTDDHYATFTQLY